MKIWLDSVPILPQAAQGASHSDSESIDEFSDDDNDCAGGDAASVASISISMQKKRSNRSNKFVHLADSQKFF